MGCFLYIYLEFYKVWIHLQTFYQYTNVYNSFNLVLG